VDAQASPPPVVVPLVSVPVLVEVSVVPVPDEVDSSLFPVVEVSVVPSVSALVVVTTQPEATKRPTITVPR
jgi:hypothetical protein